MSQKIFRMYLDNAATTSDQTMPYITDVPWCGAWHGNSHAIHREGVSAQKSVKESEKIILDHINGHDGTLIWTGSGSQANNLVCQAFPHILTSSIEHKSILQHSDSRYYVSPRLDGVVSTETMIDAYQPEQYDLISLQLINNETGVHQPVAALKEIPVFVHTDAVQALGKVHIDVEQLGVDLMTISAHKIHGPKGIGALWVRHGLQDKFPYQGTVSPELTHRFAHAVSQIDVDQHYQHVAKLERWFLDTLDASGVEYNRTPVQGRMPGILSIWFTDVDNDTLVFACSDKGVYISSGSACNETDVQPSHVLTAMQIPSVIAESTVRISIGKNNTVEQVIEAASIISKQAKELKHGS